MSFSDLLWDSGQDNLGGIVGEIYFCPIEDIESLPALAEAGSLETVVEDIVCKAGKKFHRIYHTAETGKLDSNTIGEIDGKSKQNLLSFFYPGDDETLSEQTRLLQNSPGVYICKDSRGNLRLLGVTSFDDASTALSLESPAYVQITNGTSGAAGADRRGTTFEVMHKAPHRALFYNGIIPIQEAGALFLSSEGNVLLEVPRSYGDGDLMVGGDVFIDTTDADKDVTSRMYHNDFVAPVFTTDEGVAIHIYEEGGGTRVYDPLDPLPEYQPGVPNTIYFVRDDSDDPTTIIYIAIEN